MSDPTAGRTGERPLVPETDGVDGSPAAAREASLTSMFVLLADTLVSDFDVIDVLDRLASTCVSLLHVTAAGIMLSDASGGLAVAAASRDDMRALEAFQAQSRQGPCPDSAVTGLPVHSADLGREERWPDFVPIALDAGFRSVTALPLRLRGEMVGALGLFGERVGRLGERDERLAQAFADVATIGLVQQRSAHHSTRLAEQLRAALDSRVVIEQAKGVIAEREGSTMEQAYQRLRRYAHDHSLKLTQVCTAVVERRLTLTR